MITENEVTEYRDLYYGIIKPMMKRKLQGEHITDTDIDLEIIAFGWSVDKYLAFLAVDCAQRMNELSAATGRMARSIKGVPSISASLLPQLRCPERTTQRGTPLDEIKHELQHERN